MSCMYMQRWNKKIDGWSEEEEKKDDIGKKVILKKKTHRVVVQLAELMHYVDICIMYE